MTGRWWSFGPALILALVLALYATPHDGIRSALRAAIDADFAETTSGTHEAPIEIHADWLQDWDDGPVRVGLFRGRCRVRQGEREVSAEQGVVWSTREQRGNVVVDQLTVYLEDRVQLADGRSESAVLQHFVTSRGLNIQVRGRNEARPAEDDPLLERAIARRDARGRGSLQLTQLTSPSVPTPRPIFAPPPQGQGLRRVRIFSRSSLPFNWQSRPVPDAVPPEQVTLITGGVNVLIDGVVSLNNLPEFGVVDLSADNIVIWSQTAGELGVESLQPRDSKLQIYLEGNIVVREGDNVIRASRAFYDAQEKRAIVLDAELTTFIPDLGSNLRVRAQRLRQLSEQRFQAQNAWITTSQFGVPTYRYQASDVLLEQRSYPVTGADGRPLADPTSGQPLFESRPWATLQNNALLLGETPIFYAPYLSAAAEDTKIPLDNLQFRSDRIFGTQIRSHFDLFTLTGIEKPPNTSWGLEADYLSQRGPLLGMDAKSAGVDGFGYPYRFETFGAYVHDDGVDNLGLDRRKLAPEDNNRGYFRWQHRHFLPEGIQVQSEIGYASDRNVWEQYQENRFDREKDLETLLQLKQSRDNWTWSLLGSTQFQRFENGTEWLPKGDLYVLGQPLLNGAVNWSTHTSAGYANLIRANAPSNPSDVFTAIPYVQDANGLVAMTRHELSAPFNLGPLQLAPYALGEAAAWGQSATGEGLERVYGRVGLRGSLSFFRAFPEIQSEIFNLNGLAHKMSLDFDYGYAESSRSLSSVLQFNEIDDDAQERFRQRLVTNTFGGTLPNFLDPRNYALRSGAGADLADPYHELVDDLHTLRLGWRHRWQTHVGPRERQRVKDWMTLDLGATLFPDANRDNYGENWGLFSTRYAWYFSDRTSLQAGSLLDFFDGGQQQWNVGLLSQRSLRGSLYVGFRQINASSLDSSIVSASYSYKMSPKWISTVGTAWDVAENQSRGQSLTITRVLPDFLLHFGFGYDASRNNTSLGLSLEPRFGRTRVSSVQLESLLDAY